MSIQAIDQLKATHRESLAQLDALFASLQHRAFWGELIRCALIDCAYNINESF